MNNKYTELIHTSRQCSTSKTLEVPVIHSINLDWSTTQMLTPNTTFKLHLRAYKYQIIQLKVLG